MKKRPGDHVDLPERGSSRAVVCALVNCTKEICIFGWMVRKSAKHVWNGMPEEDLPAVCAGWDGRKGAGGHDDL